MPEARRAVARSARARAISYGEPTSRQPLTAVRSSWAAAAGLAFRDEDAAEGHLAAGFHRRGGIPRDDLPEGVDRRPGQRAVTGGEGDLDLRRKEAGPGPSIPRRIRDRGIDGDAGRLDLALRQPDEGEGGLGRPAALVGLAQGGFCPFEVALQPPDVADRVEPVRLWRRGLEPPEFHRRALEFLLRAVPGPGHGRHFGTMHATDPREPGERLPIAVALGRLDPFARPPVVGQVAAGADHPARGDARRERRQLAVDRRERRLLHHRHAIGGRARRDLERAQVDHRERLQVRVGRPFADPHGLVRQGQGAIEVAACGGHLAAQERQVAVDVGVPGRFDEPLRPPDPCRRDRELAGEHVLPADIERDVRRALGVAGGLVGLERPFLRGKLVIRVRREERGLRQGLQVPSTERRSANRRGSAGRTPPSRRGERARPVPPRPGPGRWRWVASISLMGSSLCHSELVTPSSARSRPSVRGCRRASGPRAWGRRRRPR